MRTHEKKKQNKNKYKYKNPPNFFAKLFATAALSNIEISNNQFVDFPTMISAKELDILGS